MLTKNKHILRYKWEKLRADIESVIQDKKLSPMEFNALGIHEDWKAIEESIYNTFCDVDHSSERPTFLWEHFKLDTSSVLNPCPDKLLNSLVDNDETVWFFVNDDKGKLWFYEGKIKAILTVIEEGKYIDELYIGSKKYHWLICINHHNYLIATGKSMADKLRQIQFTLNSR